MNESSFIEKWELDKPAYKAWGDYIVRTICEKLEEKGKKLDIFLKIPVQSRLKENASLIDKAFYRPGKNYTDPYNQIEDKVGARFVVLLLDDIQDICDVIHESEKWTFDACKHFDDDREKEPLLFTYQSVHYILKPKSNMEIENLSIPASTTCEVQIRTLLQHAHAELTHDAIYKEKRTVKPKVHRTVAKSMALIETTDDFFTSVTKQLNDGPLKEFGVVERLDGIYQSLTGLKPHSQKSSLVVWDEYENFIDEKLVDKIQGFLDKPQYDFLPDAIIKRFADSVFYQQSVVLFIYWMLINKRRRLLSDWPFSRELLEPMAVDLGVNTRDF